MDFWMPELELDEHPRREGREDAEEDDQDQSRDDADDGESGGEGEHAVADDFGDHQDGDHLPGEGLVADLVLVFAAEDIVVCLLESTG